MITYYDLICLGSNLFRIYVIFRFACIFYNRKNTNRIIEILVYVAFFILTSIVFVKFHSPVFNIIVNISGLLIVVQLYRDSVIKKILSVLLIYIINMAADSFIVLIFEQWFENIGISGIESVISCLSVLIVELIAEKIVDTKNEYRISAMHGIPLLLIPLASIFMIAFLVLRINDNYILIIVESFFILFINTIIFYLYDSIIKSYEEKNKRDILERQLQSYMNQLEVIEQSQERIKSLKHDMKHHLLFLGDMAKKNNSNEIIEYLEEMQGVIINPEEYVNSGNDGIDTILNYMISKARELTTNVNINVHIPEGITLSQFDINIILGNLLQNAIQALEKSEHRELDISIEYKSGILYISIGNTYTALTERVKNRLSISKNNDDIHGIGLSNVRKIVDKYNGMMQIKDSKNYFTVNVMLYVL